jgi:hypothetical protein
VVDRVIRSQWKGSPVGGALIGKIHMILALDWEVMVKHSYCKTNKCAGELANIRCTFDFTIVYYNSCPIECSYEIKDMLWEYKPLIALICNFLLLSFVPHFHQKNKK